MKAKLLIFFASALLVVAQEQTSPPAQGDGEPAPGTPPSQTPAPQPLPPPDPDRPTTLSSGAAVSSGNQTQTQVPQQPGVSQPATGAAQAGTVSNVGAVPNQAQQRSPVAALQDRAYSAPDQKILNAIRRDAAAYIGSGGAGTPVRFVVRNGTVHVVGTLPGKEFKDRLINTIMNTAGVQQIVEQVTVGVVPATVGTAQAGSPANRIEPMGNATGPGGSSQGQGGSEVNVYRRQNADEGSSAVITGPEATVTGMGVGALAIEDGKVVSTNSYVVSTNINQLIQATNVAPDAVNGNERSSGTTGDSNGAQRDTEDGSSEAQSPRERESYEQPAPAR